MLIRFIHHSCFLVEVDDKVLIFDYFGGDRVNGFQFHGTLPEYEPGTRIYVFASHSHQDHYDMDVLRWRDKYPHIKYIFSRDIRISPNFLSKHGIDPDIRKRVAFMGPDGHLELDDLKIQTFRSTDAGVAFYVSTNGVSFFHGGDLNNWKWDGAGDLVNGKMEREFKFQIKQLAKLPVNIAFMAADPRLEQYQFAGLEYLLSHVDLDYVFPMHMWQDYSKVAGFKKRISNRSLADKILEITEENQEFSIND